MAALELSLTMIVRDEEDCVGAAIGSAASFVDEIVVVDTGSRDRTPEIAQRHGARVFRHPWDDDFSQARNAAIEHALGDWILVLDADELLQPGTGDEIRAAIRDTSAVAFDVPVMNLYDRDFFVPSLAPRLFRREPEIRFRGRIDERIRDRIEACAARTGRRIGTLRRHILHTGSHPSRMERRGILERNFRLYRKQLEGAPEDVRTWYRYAEFLRRLPEPEAAQPALARAYELLGTLPEEERRRHPFAADVCALHAHALHQQGREDEAREIATQTLEAMGPTPNQLFLYAEMAADRGHLDEAEALYRRCLELDGTPLAVPGDPGVTGYRSLLGLARVASDAGRREEAVEYLHRAIEDAGCRTSEPSLALADLLHSEGRFGEALNVLGGFPGGCEDDPHVSLATGKILLEIGNPRAAERWFARAGVRDTHREEASRLRARALLVQGELSLSNAIWAGLGDDAETRAARFVITTIRKGESDRTTPAPRTPEEIDEVVGFLRGIAGQGLATLVCTFAEHAEEAGFVHPAIEAVLREACPGHAAVERS